MNATVLVVGAGPIGLTMPADLPADLDVFLDPDRDAHRRYGATAGTLYLVRPDGYVAFRGRAASRPSRHDVRPAGGR